MQMLDTKNGSYEDKSDIQQQSRVTMSPIAQDREVELLISDEEIPF
jgi:hypothetical protein